MAPKIQEMFDAIAKQYDLLNTLLSLGLHKLWKKQIAKDIIFKDRCKLLDIASGTGDIALLLKKKHGDRVDIIGLDFSAEMIEIAKCKSQKSNLKIKFIVADATNIPYPDNYFDYVTIAFGIRNIPEINKCLNEISRVLKSNGKLIILEFGKPSKPFYYFYKVYNKLIIPFFGLLISRNISAYKYLAETSINYPSGMNFIEILEKIGKFNSLSFKQLCFGVAYLYTANQKSFKFSGSS
jgi:demethylmenaquinone methyltransferase/2-methoxy-6-polyprenyl-1,4-benzoquinol methylase